MIKSIRRAYTSATNRHVWRIGALCSGAVLTAALVAIFAGNGVFAATKDAPPAPTCSTAMLGLNHANTSYGTFRYVDIYTLTNTSQVTCTLEGYPDVGIRTASGGAVPSVQITDATNTGAYNVPAASQITLQPGDAAVLYMGSVGNPGAPDACDPSSTEDGVMAVTPPGDTVALTVPVPVNTSCPTATLDVSPIISSAALPTTTTSTDTTTTDTTTTDTTTTTSTDTTTTSADSTTTSTDTTTTATTG